MQSKEESNEVNDKSITFTGNTKTEKMAIFFSMDSDQIKQQMNSE